MARVLKRKKKELACLAWPELFGLVMKVLRPTPQPMQVVQFLAICMYSAGM